MADRSGASCLLHLRAVSGSDATSFFPDFPLFQVQHYRSADRFRLVENDEDCFEGQNRGPYQFRKTEVWTPDLR